MEQHSICIIGGTGFVGQHLVSRLAKEGHNLRVLTRHRERYRNLLVMPQVTLVETNIHDAKGLQAQFEGCDTVINLAGILNESGSSTNRFHKVHVELPRSITAAAKANNLQRVLHMSALNANANEPNSQYLKTKGEGEDAAHDTDSSIAVTSFRPSVIFGRKDNFFNRFQLLLRLTPLAFPLACPDSRFAPVFVGNVVDAFVESLDNKATFSKRYELCGPQEFTLQALVQYTARIAGLQRRIIGLNDKLSKLQARLLGLVPGKPFSMDNYYSLQHASVCSDPGLAQLGITPNSIDEIVPTYLGKVRTRDRYHDWRRSAGRG